jgi:hypothetical protein
MKARTNDIKTNKNTELLQELEALIFNWENLTPHQQKLSKKVNGASFSILKDTYGRYYVLDNDTTVTKSTESRGCQGDIKKFFH